MTQRNNEALKYFITNVLDDKHFFICNYDKIFYLATLISVYIFGVPFQQQETLTFYMMASALAGEKEELFLKILKGDKDARERYIKGNLRLVLSVIQRFFRQSGEF